jgi:rhodanese-related sulfurtransferase
MTTKEKLQDEIQKHLHATGYGSYAFYRTAFDLLEALYKAGSKDSIDEDNLIPYLCHIAIRRGAKAALDKSVPMNTSQQKVLVDLELPRRYNVHYIDIREGKPVLEDALGADYPYGITADEIWDEFNTGLADMITTQERLLSKEWQDMTKTELKAYKAARQSGKAVRHPLEETVWSLDYILRTNVDTFGTYAALDEDETYYVFTPAVCL